MMAGGQRLEAALFESELGDIFHLLRSAQMIWSSDGEGLHELWEIPPCPQGQ